VSFFDKELSRFDKRAELALLLLMANIHRHTERRADVNRHWPLRCGLNAIAVAINGDGKVNQNETCKNQQ